MWVEPKPIGIYNHSRRSNKFSSDEKNYLHGPKMSLMRTICVVCCWRSNFRLVIMAPLAIKINAPSTPSSLKRGRYPACYNQPLLQPAPVSPTYGHSQDLWVTYEPLLRTSYWWRKTWTWRARARSIFSSPSPALDDWRLGIAVAITHGNSDRSGQSHRLTAD